MLHLKFTKSYAEVKRKGGMVMMLERMRKFERGEGDTQWKWDLMYDEAGRHAREILNARDRNVIELDWKGGMM